MYSQQSGWVFFVNYFWKNCQNFHIKHAAARNIDGRTIGLLKSRFKWIRGTLHYHPQFVCKLINVCCFIKNLCQRRNELMPDLDKENTHSSRRTIVVHEDLVKPMVLKLK